MNAEKLRQGAVTLHLGRIEHYAVPSERYHYHVLTVGEATHDRDDWLHQSPLSHVEHAERHLQRFRWGQHDGEDHLAHGPPEF